MAKNTINFQLEGFAELEKQLIELGPKVAKKVLRGAVQSSANPIVKLARAKVPVNHGLLKKSIGVKTKTKGSTSFTVIGPKSIKVSRNGKMENPARYAHLVEYGAAPHIIEAPPGSALNVNGTFAKTVRHPGYAARPFLRPAFDSGKRAALDRLKEMLAKGILREATRGAK